jgi:hypothetical protein
MGVQYVHVNKEHEMVICTLTVMRADVHGCEEPKVFAGTSIALALEDFKAEFASRLPRTQGIDPEEQAELLQELRACGNLRDAQVWLTKVYGYYAIRWDTLSVRTE